MKKIYIVLLTTIVVFASATPLEAKGGFFKKLVKGAAEAFGAPLVESVAKKGGYTNEQAREFRENVYRDIGASNRNAELGIQYISSDNKMDKQNAVKEILWNNSGIESGKYGEILNSIKQVTDIQSDFIKDKRLSYTEQEKQDARIKRDSLLIDIAFEMYDQAKTKQAEYLAEKLDMVNQLVEKGVDPNMAREAAGTLIAIQRSDMPAEEKERYFKAFGLSQSTPKVEETIDEVCSPGYCYEYGTDTSAANNGVGAQQSEESMDGINEKSSTDKEVSFPIIDRFAFNQTALNEEHIDKLNEVVAILERNNELNILIVGHTCDIGNSMVNKRIGLGRANSAKDYLTAKGIKSTRIRTDSQGATSPLNSNSNEEERSVNRRIVISLQ